MERFYVVIKEVSRSSGSTGKKWSLPPMPWEDAVRLETAVRNALPGLDLNRAYSVGTELWEDSNDPH